MKLIYTNKTVEKQCTELRRAKKDFSDKVALKLHQLIDLFGSVGFFSQCDGSS